MNANLFDVDNGQGALLSECGKYRYRLWRLWDADAPVMVWVMLNPSTADADQDDPTIRKCIGFAKRHGHGGIIVVNLFAYRATDPKTLKLVDDPVGPENNEHILWACRAPMLAQVIAGWGAHPAADRKFNGGPPRSREVQMVIRAGAGRILRSFGRTKRGAPNHPLMLAYETPLGEFSSSPATGEGQ